MEDYEDFVQNHLSQLRQCEENRPPRTRRPSVRSCSLRSPSLISFYGQPILPPLLSEQQREEAHRVKEALQRTTDLRNSRAQARVSYVENILNNVQVLPLRKAPTMDKLFNEEQGLIESQSSAFHINTNVAKSQSDDVIEITDSLTTLPTSSLTCDGMGRANSSSLYSAFSPPNLTPHQHYQEECSVDHNENKLVSKLPAEPLIDISHQSISSGYVTYVNSGSTTRHSGGLERRGERHPFSSEEEEEEANGFFLHSTSNTITSMPDIISHPPIDGEELERCAEVSSVYDQCLLKDVCSISPLNNSIINGHSAEFASSQVQSSPTAVSQSTPMLSPELKDISLFTQEDKKQDGDECLVTSVKTSCPLDGPESAETLVTHCPSTAHQPQVPHMEMEPQDDHVSKADTKSAEAPCPPSLQVLLKRSQEYRRCQRMLRNQAKNAKTQERSQQQARKSEERESLSDKENDEFNFPHKGALATEGRKMRDKGGNKGNQVQVSSSLKTSPKSKIGVIHVTDSQEVSATFKCDNVHLIGVEDTEVLSGAQEDDTSGNTALHCTPEDRAEQSCNTLSISTDNSVGKFQTVPILQFCMSPVHCKSKAPFERAINETTVPNTQPPASTSHNVNDNTKLKVILGQENNEEPPTSSIVYSAEEGDVEQLLSSRRSSDQAQQIDQLEFNLSSLKLLITDLEASITGNMDNGCQIQNPLGHFIDKDIENINKGQLYRNCQEESNGEWQRIPLKDMEPESIPNVRWQETLNQKLSIKGTSRGEEPAPGLAHCRVQLTNRVPLATDLSMSSFKKHETSKKRQPCITSMAQRMHVPDVFRKVPSEIKVSHTGSVLLDTSNQQTERKSEMTVVLEGEESSHSLSLNQSYDVDTPSGLWLQLGSGSDSRSKGHDVQAKNLTPDSEGGGHGGISKAKRRLLMHATEGSEDKPRDGSRGSASILRPHSSTPKGHSGLEDKQLLKPAYETLHDQRKQLELLQALAVRYHVLQSVSFPCPLSSSRLGDVSISPSLLSSTFSSQLSSQPPPTPPPPPNPQSPSPVPDCYRPLVSAAVKGFLTRRLLKTERVAQLLRTIKDTRQFLLTFQTHTPGRGIQTSRQDILLLERVTLQLRSARYELYDIFFSLSARERMQLISWDRELVRERERRRQSGETVGAKGKTSLSPATQKSLERKRGVMIQKKATGNRTVNRTRHKTERPSESKRGQFKPNPQRVPKTTNACRPR